MNVSIAKRRVKLGNLPNGKLFFYKDTLALKSEYKTTSGACECFVIGSGEIFWGDASTPEELNNLYVTPISITKE